MDDLFSEVSALSMMTQTAPLPTIPSYMYICSTGTQVFSSNQAPFGPTSFLFTTWRISAAEMSGYSQQDAHEFFITALDLIHAKCRGSTNISCNCIIHQTFAGQLQSDVRCERCGNTTSTVDPMLDISLELRGKGGEVSGGENTLAGCLRRCADSCCAL